MSRKEKFSKNWTKAKAKVKSIHARIGNARRDYLHKATTTISQNHAMACIEDLVKYAGEEKIDCLFTFSAAVYNLVRMRNLGLAAP